MDQQKQPLEMLIFFDLLIFLFLLNSNALFHDWRTTMCGSLYRTCCLSLSPFLSTPKKLLLQKDLCLPLGERRTRRTAASKVTAQAATGGGLQLARLPGALNQARQTRRSTRLSATVRNFKLMEAALP